MNMLRFALAVIASAFLLSACSPDSGKPGVTNLPRQIDGDVDQQVQYRGPNPQSAEVRDFKINFWDNVAMAGRCGGCHIPGEQSPYFARQDDINLAYTEALGYANLQSPGDSRFVAKVAGGHGCWVASNNFCAEQITRWITGWASDAGIELTQTQLNQPELWDVGASISFPDDPTAFEQHVQPLLTRYCGDCHRASAPQAPVQPYFASDDPFVAYPAARTKMLLNVIEQEDGGHVIDASRSRLVVRLREEAHNCWDNDCQRAATQLQQALEVFAADLPIAEADGSLLTSKAMRVEDGTAISQGGRAESNAIALYSFKAGAGAVVYDYADNFPPALDLTLSGDVEWVSNWGIRLNSGRAQGAVAASSKLRRYIGQTGEYSVEAWVVPANVTQEGPARIVSYSGSNDRRNFTLGQTLYNYNFFNRSNSTDINGSPMISTEDAAEVLQATLQHVVASYDALQGRRLYVNGVEVAREAPGEGGVLADWDDTFALVLGNETSGEYPWRGTLRFLAIHNRVLTPEQITTNFQVGVGQKILVPFSIADHVDGIDDAYLVFQVEQFDDYSYLFTNPRFYRFSGPLDRTIEIDGLYIGVNGREAPVGQAFANLELRIPAGDYSLDSEPLSRLGAVIALEKGPDLDQFFLSFDRVNSHSVTRIVPSTPLPEELQDLPAAPEIGVRHFAEINASLASMTGVAVTHPEVMNTYAAVEQQMPSVEKLDGFLVAHQMGITQLTVKYCNVLANDAGRRAALFPDFADRFDETGRSAVIEPLLEALVAHTIDGDQLSTQPEVAQTRAQLQGLFSELSPECTQSPYSCSADSVSTIITAVCAAALGSAVMLVQ